MHKKILIGLVLALTLVFSFTFCYAESEMQKASDSAKNFISGAENAVEGAVQDAGNMIKGATNSVKDGAEDLGNTVMNNGKNTMQSTIGDNDDYTATRTSGEGTFMGMTSNTWSWLILGIAAIAIIALVWYYSIQLNNNRPNDNNQQ